MPGELLLQPCAGRFGQRGGRAPGAPQPRFPTRRLQAPRTRSRVQLPAVAQLAQAHLQARSACCPLHCQGAGQHWVAPQHGSGLPHRGPPNTKARPEEPQGAHPALAEARPKQAPAMRRTSSGRVCPPSQRASGKAVVAAQGSRAGWLRCSMRAASTRTQGDCLSFVHQVSYQSPPAPPAHHVHCPEWTPSECYWWRQHHTCIVAYYIEYCTVCHVPDAARLALLPTWVSLAILLVAMRTHDGATYCPAIRLATAAGCAPVQSVPVRETSFRTPQQVRNGSACTILYRLMSLVSTRSALLWASPEKLRTTPYRQIRA